MERNKSACFHLYLDSRNICLEEYIKWKRSDCQVTEREKNGEILLKGHNVLVKQDEFERYSKQQYDCWWQYHICLHELLKD